MLKKTFWLILFFITLSFDTYSIYKNHGIYIWPSTFYEMGNPQNVINQLKLHSISDIFLLVKGEAGYTFFQSEFTFKDYLQIQFQNSKKEEERRKLLSKIDFFSDSTLLMQIINLAHLSNIKVHAWFIISGDKHFVENNPGIEVVRLPNLNIEKHPYPLTNKGHINLANSEYQKYIFGLIDKALQYPFDGLMLDKIRYTSLVYSWDEIHISKAIRDGVDINKVIECAINTTYGDESSKEDFLLKYRDYDKDIRKWVEIKKADVEEYVKEANRIARDKKIILSASFMPEGTYDEDFSDVYYAQNFADLSKYFDFIAVMAYPKSFSQSANWLKMVIANAKEKSTCKIWSAIQCYDSVSSDLVYDQVKNSRIVNADGIAIFRLGEMTDELWNAYHQADELDIQKQASQISGIIYSGKGSIRNCWSKSSEALLLDDNIIPFVFKEDALKKYESFINKDFIVMPGGGGSSEAEALDTIGLKNIEKFVSEGGGYIGICAGSYLPVKGYGNNLTNDLQIVNAEINDVQHWDRGNGEVEIKKVKDHPVFNGIKEDTFKMNYFNGPILVPSDLQLPPYKELAIFQTDFHENGARPGDMQGSTAILETNYNSGKIILFSPHPELTAGKERMLINAAKYVTGK